MYMHTRIVCQYRIFNIYTKCNEARRCIKLLQIIKEGVEIKCMRITVLCHSRIKSYLNKTLKSTFIKNILSTPILIKRNVFLKEEYRDLEVAKEAIREGQIWCVLHFAENYTSSLLRRLEMGQSTDDITADNSTVSVWMDMSSMYY